MPFVSSSPYDPGPPPVGDFFLFFLVHESLEAVVVQSELYG